MKISRAGALGLTVLLAACGKPDASGIYVFTNDREVTLIQLVQADDGKLTGRLQVAHTEPDGTITTKHGVVDGSVSGHDLMLRPASVWFGGLQASGTFSGSKLNLTGNGFSLEAKRSTLDGYKEEVAKLQTAAGEKREQVAVANAAAVQRQSEARAAKADLDTSIQISNVADRLRLATTKLNEALSRSPNFGQQAMANTARIAQLVKRANGQSDLARNQLAVAANQIEVETNQIEVSRSQYAIGLNGIVNAAKDAGASLSKLCGKNPPAQFNGVCGEAMAAANEFKDAYLRGTKTFTPYKQQVQTEMDRQSELSHRIDG